MGVPGFGVERWFAFGVWRNWVGSEIVIEGNILVENHHDVLDGHVAVEADFRADFDAANAGITLGPRAVVNAVSKASIFLGVADALIFFNIFFLRPSANPHRSVEKEWLAEDKGSIVGPCGANVTRRLKLCELRTRRER